MSNPRENHTPLATVVARFMALAEQTTDRFNARQACLYTGLQLEELAEKIEVIMGGCVTQAARDHLAPLHSLLTHYAKEFKEGLHQGDILRSSHKDLIDADYDLAFVSIGALLSTSVNGLGAIAHGNHTNLDKFRNGADKDENGKQRKPADWQRPDFEPYTDKLCKV